MRKALHASVLALLLSVSAYGGEMQNGAPVPPPPVSTPESTTDGEVPNLGPGTLTEAVFGLLGGLLGVL